MKLVFTGAGGGHFTPLIAVAESIRAQVFMQKISTPEMYFMSDKPYDERALFDNGIKFIEIPAGKLHVFAALDSLFTPFKMFWGTCVALKELYGMYPDVIFAKGGYASFPVLLAARILSIPVIVHESDSVAGRVTSWADSFAERVAISQKEAAPYFKNKQIALTGQPVRAKLLPPDNFVRHAPPTTRRPVLLVLGGSQGSQKLNDTILAALPELLTSYDIVHQTGPTNIATVKAVANKLLENNEFKDRYYVEGLLDLGIFYPKVDVVVTRAGSTTLFETALWRIPQVVIPIPESISRDQRSNAYAFARLGTCTVIEENNLSPHILMSELSRILQNPGRYEEMAAAGAKVDYSRNAASSIASEMIRIALTHYE
jgi:UDP-N-acetylglucosamine--N-acetylmuramyl-(pentapeptide) pyrophosphoryl-undecaprenol N-acetylglucosamine transferase